MIKIQITGLKNLPVKLAMSLVIGNRKLGPVEKLV